MKQKNEVWLAYERSLRHFDIIKAYRISQDLRPSRLYCYGREAKYIDSILAGNIHFTAPSEFNDPLDSRWFVNYEAVVDARLRKAGLGEVDRVLMGALRQVYDEDVSWPMQNNAFVRCLSETPYSNPMWSHYAGNHHGYCVAYDVDALVGNGALLMPMVYSKSPLDASKLIDGNEPFAAIAPLLFKDLDWSYEREWRLILPRDSGSDTVKEGTSLCFGPSAVVAIYTGLRCDSEVFRLVDSIEGGNGIARYQVERSYMSYELTSDTFEDMRNGARKGLYP